MAKREPFKAHRITLDVLDKLEKKKAQLSRHDSMTAFICWILDLYAEGKLEEAPILRARLEAELGSEIEAKVRLEMARSEKTALAGGAERIQKIGEHRKAS